MNRAEYGYDGPKDKAVTDPCLDPPETFDECTECSPCFIGMGVGA